MSVCAAGGAHPSRRALGFGCLAKHIRPYLMTRHATLRQALKRQDVRCRALRPVANGGACDANFAGDGCRATCDANCDFESGFCHHDSICIQILSLCQ